MRLVLTATLYLTAAASRAEDSAKAIVFSNVTVVDVESGRLLAHRSVVVNGAGITAATEIHGFKAPPGSRVIPATGKYLIPGL
jgi:adenine deaminase